MGKLKSNKVVRKCLSLVPAIALCGCLFCSADLLYSELKSRNIKKDVCKENESAYVDFVNYEISKMTNKYFDNSITFDDYVSHVENLSDKDKKEDYIIENFATDSQKQQIANCEKRDVADMVGITVSLGSLFAYEHFDLLGKFDNSEKEL